MWQKLSNYRDGALLFLRIFFGGLFLYVHGWPMLAGGLGKWKALGGAMRHVGVNLWPAFWGFLAAFSSSIGMGLFIIGLCFRPSCLLLTLTMLVASVAEYRGHGLGEASHALELCLVFFALLFIGPGKFSVDKG